MNSKEPFKTFPCTACNEVYKHARSLTRHKKKAHNVSIKAINSVQCYLCDYSFINCSLYRDHLKTNHDKVTELETLRFPSMDEFIIWKDQIEPKNVYFIKSNGVKKRDEKEVTYYRCNRTGHYKDKVLSERKKNMKIQGTSKIGFHCTAGMIMIKEKDGITVQYHKTHHGHSIDVEHIPLNIINRKQVTTQLKLGVNKEHISDSSVKDINELKSNNTRLSVKDQSSSLAKCNKIHQKLDCLKRLIDLSDDNDNEWRAQVEKSVDHLLSLFK